MSAPTRKAASELSVWAQKKMHCLACETKAAYFTTQYLSSYSILILKIIDYNL
jgi:hypothetical protein